MNVSRHVNNLRRAAGVAVSGTNGRYEVITNTDELTKAFLQSKSDLAYSLKKERTRDRYVANRTGLEKAIADVVNRELQGAASDLSQYTAAELVDNINAAFGLTSGNRNKTNSFETAIGRTFGKAIIELPLNLLDDIFNDE